MMFYTHVAAALLATIFFVQVYSDNPILYTLLIMFGTILPDIDHPNSKLGKRFKWVGWLFQHRGIFHSIIPPAILGYCVYVFVDEKSMYAFLVGYFIHLLLDGMTRKGIMPFFPINKSLIRGRIKTKGLVEHIFFFVLLMISAIILLQ